MGDWLKMDSKHQMYVAVVGLGSVTIMVSFALYLGINGTVLATAVGVVSAIVGYVFGVKKAGE